ncbi:MAG: DUF4296 domain-containing protein [Flavobacteriaceae bacterium]
MPKDLPLIAVKMKNTIGALFFCLAIISCGEKVLEAPENLIPKDKMVDILADLAIITAAKTTNISILTKNKVEPTPYLLKKYKIDSMQLVESDRYYASLPDEYEEIYSRVEEKLDRQAKVMDAAKRARDSLRMLEIEDGSPNLKPKDRKFKDSLP